MSLAKVKQGSENEAKKERTSKEIGDKKINYLDIDAGNDRERIPTLSEHIEKENQCKDTQNEEFENNSLDDSDSDYHKRRHCTSFRLLLRRQLWVGTVRMAATLRKLFRSKHSSHGVRRKKSDSVEEKEEPIKSPIHVPSSSSMRLLPQSPELEEIDPSEILTGATSTSTRILPQGPISITASPESSPTKNSVGNLNNLFRKPSILSPLTAPVEPNPRHMKAVRSRRLLKEFHELKKIQLATNDPIFTVDLVNDCLYEWKVKLLRIDPESELARDMVEFNVPYILLNMSFPDAFPFQPPFLRVLAPRLEKGFVMEGGAICMELLTPKGWASAYTIEAVVMQFAASLVKGQGRISRKHKNPKEFNKRSAEASFRSLVKTHDKYGWVTPPLSEG